MKKSTTLKTKTKKSEVQFCTECGEELDDLSLQKSSEDVNSLKERFHKCKTTGKFKGDFCSQLFIVDDKTLGSVWENEE